MTGRTHLAAGLLTGEILVTATRQPDLLTAIIAIGAATFGSILPDIDHPGSMVSTSSRSSRVVSSTVTAVTRHRGFTHTLPFIALIVLAINYFLAGKLPNSEMVSMGLCAGMLSHLLLDTLNEKGIMWLWPFSKKPLHTATIRTGSQQETVLRTLLNIAATAALVWFFYTRISSGRF